MNEYDKGGFSLAIETAIGGGSLALFKDGEPVDGWVGSGSVSRSEDLLAEIEKILARSEAKRKRIKNIIISNGPGSFTGARIGAAIGKGLSKALGCRLTGRSILEAMAARALLYEEVAGGAGNRAKRCDFLTAAPSGAEGICLQRFICSAQEQCVAVGEPERWDFSAFKTGLQFGVYDRIVVQSALFWRLVDSKKSENPDDLPLKKIYDAGENLAFSLGANLNMRISAVLPIYV